MLVAMQAPDSCFLQRLRPETLTTSSFLFFVSFLLTELSRGVGMT